MTAADAADSRSVGIGAGPFYFLGLAIGFGVERLIWAAPQVPGLGAVSCMALGFGLVVAGVVLLSAARRAMHRADTPIDPAQPSRALVCDGIYSRSRNPVYVGGILIYSGIAIAGRSLVSLALLSLVVTGVRYIVIAREEAYLRPRFGTVYEQYCSRVRRWI